jgi:glutamate-1-semialdehyde 2,1-aminomutase
MVSKRRMLVEKRESKEVLESEKVTFESRTKKSLAMFNSAKESTPFGVHSNYRFTDPYPIYGRKSRGQRIWDVDGNEYLDFNMGFGALVTGHSHPVLVEAISEQLSSGTVLGLEFADSDKLAKVVKERFNADMVRFSSTGMEATMLAMRIARAYTGRNKIIKFEGCYHGSHEQALVSVKPRRGKEGNAKRPRPVPASLGIPPDTIRNTIVAPFNDLEAVEGLVKENSDDFAAIILEPIPMNMGFVMPDPEFLKGLRKLCDESNSVLIFDEVKTCGKYYGGATERFGIYPDLKVLGKAIAGGFPLSAVVGKREIMQEIIPGVVAHAGTFNSNPISITAGLVSLTKILTKETMARIGKLSQRLALGYYDVVKDNKLKAVVVADGVSGVLSFSKKPVRNWRDFQGSDIGSWFLYYMMMVNRGIIPAGTGPDEQWTVSAQHTEEDIEHHIEVFKLVAPALKDFEHEMPVVEAI